MPLQRHRQAIQASKASIPWLVPQVVVFATGKADNPCSHRSSTRNHHILRAIKNDRIGDLQ